MVLGDTGAVYALIDRSDAWHRRVLDWWDATRHGVVLPVTTLPEIAYLLHARIGPAAEAAFLEALEGREFEWIGLDSADVTRAADLLETYRDLRLGFVDATIVAMAERLAVTTILTTDRKHFGAVRPSHTPVLSLVP